MASSQELCTSSSFEKDYCKRPPHVQDNLGLSCRRRAALRPEDNSLLLKSSNTSFCLSLVDSFDVHAPTSHIMIGLHLKPSPLAVKETQC